MSLGASRMPLPQSGRNVSEQKLYRAPIPEGSVLKEQKEELLRDGRDCVKLTVSGGVRCMRDAMLMVQEKQRRLWHRHTQPCRW